MKTLSPGLAAHLAGGVTMLCHCWQVARKDSVVMGFTDHDRELVIDSVTYKAASGFTATAIEDQLGLAVSNLNVDGALSSAAITEHDLQAGRYDNAAVAIMRVNWQEVTQRVILRSGFIGQVSRGETVFSAELRGLAARLDHSAGRVFQRACAWELGDGRCQIDLSAAANHGAGTGTALDDFEVSLPNAGTVLLVAGWFGDDLRRGNCSIRPKVETATKTTTPNVWKVHTFSRGTAIVVTSYGDRAAYGGTPSDDSIVRAIRDLKARSYTVVFYPVLFKPSPTSRTQHSTSSENENSSQDPPGRPSPQTQKPQSGQSSGHELNCPGSEP